MKPLECYKILKDCANVRPNWNSHNAIIPTAESVARASHCLFYIYKMGMSPRRISADAEGGIAISFKSYDCTREASITFFNADDADSESDTIALISIADENKMKVWEVEDLHSAMWKIKDFIQGIHEW